MKADIRYQNAVGQPDMVWVTPLTEAGCGGIEALLPVHEAFNVRIGLAAAFTKAAASDMAATLDAAGLVIDREDRNLPAVPQPGDNAAAVARIDAKSKAMAHFIHLGQAIRANEGAAAQKWALSMDIREKASAIAGIYAGSGDATRAVQLLRAMADALEVVTS